MKSRKRLTPSLVSFPSTFRTNNVLLSLYAIQHQKKQPQNVGISPYQIFSVSLIMHRYALFTILRLSFFFFSFTDTYKHHKLENTNLLKIFYKN